MPKVGAISNRPRLKVKGFSLVEILVAVMVLLVIAAISIPNLLRAHMRANEAAAVASVSIINTGETVYANAYPLVGFAGKLSDLGSQGSDCQSTSKASSCIIIDDALTSGVKSGYVFELAGDGSTPLAKYTLTAAPQSPGLSGRCTYTSDQSGQIQVAPAPAVRFSTGGGITCSQL
jgi:prepilin-type N-terminal cleavage/methylation domain-containing protein